MPLLPNRVKYRKQQRGRMRGKATRGHTIACGEYGLQSLESGWITNVQIEACRIAINRSLKRKGKVWIRIFPDKPISKKPLEVRMGKGKGNTEQWVAPVKAGTMLFEVDGTTGHDARVAMRLAATKLPVNVQFVERHRHG